MNKTVVQGAVSLRGETKQYVCFVYKMLVNNIGISNDLKNVFYYQFFWLAIRKLDCILYPFRKM